MIVADTGAMVALVDADDQHHEALRLVFESEPWVLPWAILPEVDYILGACVNRRAQRLFFDDIAAGAFVVEWGNEGDVERAAELDRQYDTLGIGLVDGVVMAVAERLGATGIATLDVRDFGSVAIRGEPRLLPRDL